jgi:mannose-1-phosphate guanylyltransferase/mannose-6-phosphate isomerase
MIVFVIAGGSGTRLWPLSTHEFPKHLLKLTNKDSLLQNTITRVKKITSTDKIFVISEISHVHHVEEQLPDIVKDNIMAEPSRRGTASCIAWALSEVKKRGLDANEPILFLWADSLIRNNDGFAASALKAGEVAADQKTVVFIGAEPTYASTGFGYMHKGKQVNGWQGIHALEAFVEKPDKKTADMYYESGDYLWNMGYMVGTLQDYEDRFNSVSPDMKQRYELLCNAKNVSEAYSKLENVAIDYAFSEHLKDALVLHGTFDWMDLGSFGDLHDVSLQDDRGNHVHGTPVELESTTNSYIRNETDVPVAVIGLDNVIVVTSPNGVLVTNKNYSQKVGDVAKKLQGKNK